MTRRRWIADEFADGVAVLKGEQAAHLARSLRARVGQVYDIACGERVFRGVISRVADDSVAFDLAEEVMPSSPGARITLLLSIFKFDRMEWAIEKCTELNAASIVPVIAHRTEKHLAQAAAKRVQRWRRLALEAAQQSRRIVPPDISDPVKLEPAIGAAHGSRIVLAENEQQLQLVDALRNIHPAPAVSLAIGPEGGWTAGELQLFREARWLPASLGPTILRAETAAMAALAIASAALDRTIATESAVSTQP